MYSHVTAQYNTGGGGAGFVPLSTTLVANGTYLVPAGMLLSMSAKSVGATAAFNAGITPGGIELVEAAALAAGVTESFNLGIYFDVDTLVYFTGITSSTLIKFYHV